MPASLVSCFLPVLNAEQYLSAWWARNGPELKAVDANLIVVDNGSTDKTLSIVEGFKYSRIVIVRHGENLGLEQSFRSAKALISSKYRFFLPADDWVAPGYLAESLKVMESDSEVGVVYGKGYTVDLASQKAGERFRPYRLVGPRREWPFSTILFNNYIPDISLYRSCHLDCNANSPDWFLPGWQSAVLHKSKVHYTGRDQSYSGKSAGQVSKEWARSGRYYSEFFRLRAGARAVCCESQSAELMLHLIEANFHTGKGFLELLSLFFAGGHAYVRAALEKNREELLALIASVLADELVVEPSTRTVRRAGRYGSFDDLTKLLGSLSSETRDALSVEFEGKGFGGVFS